MQSAPFPRIGSALPVLRRGIDFGSCLGATPRPHGKEIPIQPCVIGPSGLTVGPSIRSTRKECSVPVLVRDNHIDQALKVLKKKMQREGMFREMKLRGHYEKPSERRVREKTEAIRRARKLARKKLQREGLLPIKKRVAPAEGAARGPPRPPRF